MLALNRDSEPQAAIDIINGLISSEPQLAEMFKEQIALCNSLNELFKIDIPALAEPAAKELTESIREYCAVEGNFYSIKKDGKYRIKLKYEDRYLSQNKQVDLNGEARIDAAEIDFKNNDFVWNVKFSGENCVIYGAYNNAIIGLKDKTSLNFYPLAKNFSFKKDQSFYTWKLVYCGEGYYQIVYPTMVSERLPYLRKCFKCIEYMGDPNHMIDISEATGNPKQLWRFEMVK